MTDEAEYERKAEECIRLAETSSNPEERAQLLTMAQAWRRLAAATANLRTLNEKK